MNLDEVLIKRFSCRSFDENKKVPYKLVNEILESARLSPSAGNLQSWRFVVVTNEEKFKKIAAGCLKQLWINSAPVLIVVCSDCKNTKRHFGVRGEFYSIQECAAAATLILLKATDINLGACWVGAFDEEAVKSILHIKEGVRPQTIIALGYPTEEPAQKERFPLDLVCSFDEYGSKRDTEFFPVEKQVDRAKASSKRGVRRLFKRKKN